MRPRASARSGRARCGIACTTPTDRERARGPDVAARAVRRRASRPAAPATASRPSCSARRTARGLRPLALAEVWWGAPPLTGGRHAGVYYPSCRGKCGPILPHMLDGLDAEPAPVFGATVIAADEPRAVYEDVRIRFLAVEHRQNHRGDLALDVVRLINHVRHAFGGRVRGFARPTAPHPSIRYRSKRVRTD